MPDIQKTEIDDILEKCVQNCLRVIDGKSKEQLHDALLSVLRQYFDWFDELSEIQKRYIARLEGRVAELKEEFLDETVSALKEIRMMREESKRMAIERVGKHDQEPKEEEEEKKSAEKESMKESNVRKDEELLL